MVSITLVLHISIISLLQSNSISQHAIILWWEIKLYLKLMCMCITLGSMYVELNELTAHIFLINFHWPTNQIITLTPNHQQQWNHHNFQYKILRNHQNHQRNLQKPVKQQTQQTIKHIILLTCLRIQDYGCDGPWINSDYILTEGFSTCVGFGGLLKVLVVLMVLAVLNECSRRLTNHY